MAVLTRLARSLGNFGDQMRALLLLVAALQPCEAMRLLPLLALSPRCPPPLTDRCPPRLTDRCHIGMAEGAKDGAPRYWEAFGAAWERPLRTLDVQAAWSCGELDGILPSGKPSRSSTDRLLTLARALQLYESGDLPVRRRFRNHAASELAPRWERVVARRAAMQADGRWDEILREGEQYRQRINSPLGAASRAVSFRPESAECGAFAELLSTAGDDAEERWLTAALLADFEAEVNSLPAAPAPAPARSFSAGFKAREDERDEEKAQAFGVSGVVAGLLFGGLLNWYIVGYLGARPDGGVADGLERSLDLLQ